MSALSPETQLLLINGLFLAGLVLLMLAAALVIMRSGLFKLFFQGFAKMKTLFFRQARVLESDLYREGANWNAGNARPLYKMALFAFFGLGILLLLASIGLTFAYYRT